MKITLSNISSFIEGNLKYYANKLFNSPEYIKEQVYYRLNLCKDDCLIENKCKYCTCPPRKKSWATTSCNKGERFPDLLNKPDWEEYKKTNNIKIETHDKERL